MGDITMNRWKSVIFFTAIAVCIFLLTSSIFAGTGKRRGTSGAQELMIPVGSVGTALGGANLASVSGIEAIYWNPAGLAASQSSAEVMISNLQYIADMNVNYVAANVNTDGFGALGVSIKSIGFGDIPVTTNDNPDGTGEKFSPSFITLGLTYSRVMTNKILFGCNVKLISERIMQESASGLGFDFGLQYNTGIGLKLGIALKNIGGNMKFDGNDLEIFTTDQSARPDAVGENVRVPLASFDLPATFEIGMAYEYKINDQNGLNIMGTFLNDNYAMDEYRVGAEYSFNNLIFLRGSYQLGYDADDESIKISDEDNFLFGPSFGVGLNLDLGPNFNVHLDYSYRMTEIFDDNQWFTLRLCF